ncbi:MAG: peptidyl-prolyl cis-trans isomerase [Clostridiaceae bacterium]|nr:peptidyl-prolyl cis-trans isomerase [Clostridiaceae bacterium]
MNKRKQLITGTLIIALALGTMTGCSETITKESVRVENGDLDENSVVIAVGDTGVKYSEALNYCYLMKKQYEGSFGSKLWNYQVSKNTTIGDEAKEEIINQITQLKIICDTAENEEVALTNDEKDEALSMAEEAIADATEEDKETYALSVQGLSELYQENLLANKMFYISTDDADTEVTDEEAQQIKIQYIKIITEGTLPNGTEVQLSEKEQARVVTQMKKWRKEAAESDNFLDLAKENSDSDTYELTIGKDSTEIDSKAVDAAFELKKGKMSQVIEGDGACYLILCIDDNDEDATYSRKEEIIEERQTKMFQEKYEKWLGDSEVSISKSFWREFSLAG